MCSTVLQLTLLVTLTFSTQIFAEGYGGAIGNVPPTIGNSPPGTQLIGAPTGYVTPHHAQAAQTMGNGADMMMIMAMLQSQSADCRGVSDTSGDDDSSGGKKKKKKKGNGQRGGHQGNCGQDKFLQAMLLKKMLDEMKEKDCKAQGGQLVPASQAAACNGAPNCPNTQPVSQNSGGISSLMPMLMAANGGKNLDPKMLAVISSTQSNMVCLVQPIVVVAAPKPPLSSRSAASVFGARSAIPPELQRELVDLEKQMSNTP